MQISVTIGEWWDIWFIWEALGHFKEDSVRLLSEVEGTRKII